jgi:hypothetical protein
MFSQADLASVMWLEPACSPIFVATRCSFRYRPKIQKQIAFV